MKSIFLLLAILVLVSLNGYSQTIFDIQGHRGARGVYPENSIPGVIYAINTGVTTLEMDVVITADGEVVLSHEPFMSREICTPPADNPHGPDVPDEAHNIYEMTYQEVKQYDCGSKKHPHFPEQKRMKVYKPLLSEVIDSVEQYLADNELPKVYYNIETKSTPEGDEVFHPGPEEFVETVMQVVKRKGIIDRVVIQSFDVRTLQHLHKKYLNIKTVLLISDENREEPDENIQMLGFIPDIYSSHYSLVNPELITYAHDMDMLVIPWTVNETEDMVQLIEMGVDGIITDYPERLAELIR